jgi:hypothetical protein
MLDTLSPLARRVFDLHRPDAPAEYMGRADPFTDDAAYARIDAAYSELLAAGLVVAATAPVTFDPGLPPAACRAALHEL